MGLPVAGGARLLARPDIRPLVEMYLEMYLESRPELAHTVT
jgi:hypothetical protein